MNKNLLLLILMIVWVNVFAQNSKKSVGDKFLRDNQAVLQISDLDIQDARIADMYTSEHNGLTHIYYNQTHNGIPVYNAILNLNITKTNNVLFYHNGFVKDIDSKVNTNKSRLSSVDAITSTALALGIQNPDRAQALKRINNRGEEIFAQTNFSKDEIRVRQIYFEDSETDVKLAYEVSFHQSNSTDSWSSKVDAVTGTVIELENRTVYCSHAPGKYHKHSPSCAPAKESYSSAVPFGHSKMSASYRVYPVPLESPVHGAQELVTDPHFPDASPFGWHDIDGIEGPEYTITRGNNVHAYNDENNDGQSLGDEPDGGTDLLFDIPHDLLLEPDFNRESDVVNLFYANNMIHDITYLTGFNEEAGNFQANNYGNGGLDSDYVVAHSLDGSGVNNANFSIVPDGVRGNMNMFRWSIPQSRLFSILEPSELSKDYQNGAAGAGWGFNENYAGFDITAELAPAYDDDPQFSNNVCGEVINAEEVEGKIAMIYRGRCEFGTKSLNAQNAGAIAVIICNVPGAGNDPTSDGNDPISNGMGPGANGASVTIPVFALGFEDCNRIVATIEEGNSVVGRILAEETGGPAEVSSGFDNGIIFHEFGHGISSRLTGGPNQVCLGNDEQMGEGWSDFFALALTVEPGDRGEDARGIGSFVQGEDRTGRGIRRFPYSTDMNVNPQTFKDIKATAAPHPLGEVWVDMLWDIFWGYVDKYGYDADWTNTESGNFKAVQLVLDGMKIQGCNPGFIRGRDAIIAAEEANTGGENKCMLWEMFARRGLGYFADGGSSNNRNDGTENFDPLPECLKTLKIYKDLPELVEVDTDIEVQLIIANHKDETVENVLVTDEIPEGMSYVMGSSNEEPIVIGNSINFEFDSLRSQEWDTITFSLQHDNTLNSTVLFNNRVETPEELNEWQRELIADQTNIFRLNSNTVFPTYSGESCWFVQEIDDDTEASIRFDNIEVVGERPAVRFWHRINTEFARNGGFVEISTDGVIWTDVKDLFIRNGYECPLAFTTFAIPALQAFSGRTEENDYVDSYIDLTDYIGQTISLKFRFGTNSGDMQTVNNEVFPADGGWFIDDVDLIDLVIDETQACISADSDIACTEDFTSVLDPQLISSNTEAEELLTSMRIYPNPASDFIIIDLANKYTENARIEISDARGQLVYSENIRDRRNVLNINTSELATGIYFVQYRTLGELITQKVIIE